MSPSIVIASPSLKPCCCASLRPMTQALRSFLNAASCSGGTWNSGYRSKNVSGSTARRGQKFLKSLGSPYTPPNQFAHDTAVTPGTRRICWRYGSGTGKMKETLWCVIMRFAADAATPAFHAPTMVRIRPNAMTAVAIPSIVSTMRSRCRNTFLRTILTSFTAAPPPPPPPPPHLSLVQVAHHVPPAPRLRVLRRPHPGLVEFLVQPLGARRGFLGPSPVPGPGALVRRAGPG